ncbi:MAG: ABC transporter ATP-binding protein [Roseburia sp.]
MADQDILQVLNVQNHYDENGLGIFRKKKRTKVLNDVTFNIHKNEFFGLVGESGCGKSTLGKSILGLIPFEGSILVNGIPYSRKNKLIFTKNVQAVFQDPLSALNPKRTIGFTMEEPLKIHHIGNKQERIRKVNEMLDLVGLDASYRNRYPRELSGGQRQRVCIGASLMLDPKLVIADEAISALDVSVGSQILNLFKKIHQEKEFSMLFISHNLNVVYYLCDRIAVMYCGNIVELGSAEDVYNRPGHPYTKLLLSAIPDIESEGSEQYTDKGEIQVENEAFFEGCCFYHRCPYATEACKKSPPMIETAQEGGASHLVRCNLFSRERSR